MARNLYFSDQVKSEHELYENIVIESLKIYGQDVYYIPRDLVNEDTIFGDDAESSFNSAYKIEMYIDNIEGFDGEGDLFTRFGVEIRDEATFVVARRRWSQTVKRFDNEITGDRPFEGDLIYLPLSKSIFQITHVEHEMPFYQIGNLNVYKLRAQLFEYTGEDFDTGVTGIDTIEEAGAYQYLITVDSATGTVAYAGDSASQTLSTGVIVTGEVIKYSDSDGILYLAHVGADDGNFHTFVTGRDITFGGLTRYTRNVSAVSELNEVSNNEQNDAFGTIADDFLDFTEDNPFGEPS